MNLTRKQTTTLIILAGLLVSISLISLVIGQLHIPLSAFFAFLGEQTGFFQPAAPALSEEQAAVLYHVRLPRLFTGILVGAALAVSGAVMQGIFGNPLAEPGIIGVSSGASFGAVLSVAFSLTSLSMYMMPLCAIAGALAAVSLTLLLTKGGKTPVMVLLLAGVAVGIIFGALTSSVLTFMNEQKLREYLFWTIGGLDYRNWGHIYLAAGPIILGITTLTIFARHLNALSFGEESARAVGVPVIALRLAFLFLATISTAFAVCISGGISFVGLVVPHIMRLILGPEHRALLPAAALAGAAFLVGCDTLGRMIIPPLEIRVGIMTALVGAPYFLYLLRRVQKQGGLS
ncbi:MAG: iron ABC transporter permease [Sporomusaceae bacterium]|jgi:iron complex transport system permease protein|nr:iron ABC transporter permease [Sporomusaceae bacterium]